MPTLFQRLACSLLLFVPLAAGAQHGRPDAAAQEAAQREAMRVLAQMDGIWRGTATTVLPDGGKHTITQTERVGSFLDGAIKVIEGRGYEADGKMSFNALGIVSYNPQTKSYNLRAHHRGQAGDFSWRPTPDGFIWEVPAGPNAVVRYTATVKDGTWHEVGDYVAQGREPLRTFEMTLKRIGDTDWPAGNPVVPR